MTDRLVAIDVRRPDGSAVQRYLRTWPVVTFTTDMTPEQREAHRFESQREAWDAARFVRMRCGAGVRVYVVKLR